MGTGWYPRPLSGVVSSLLPHLRAGLTIAAAALILLARVTCVPSPNRVLCGIGPMKPNAAFCLLLAGVSLALVRRAGTSRARAVIGEAPGAVVAIVGTLAVAESLAARDSGIDRLLY